MIQSTAQLGTRELVRCNGLRCPSAGGNVLGEWIGRDTLQLAQGGREALITEARRVSIRCERCGYVNKVR